MARPVGSRPAIVVDSHMMQGRLADARRSAAELADRLLPHAAMMPMIESMAVAPVSVLRFALDDEVLAVAEPPADRPVMRAWRHYARGVAFARKRQDAEADAERQALMKATAAVPDSALSAGPGSRARDRSCHRPARRSMRESRRRAATTSGWPRPIAWRTTPPVWYYPMRESLGAALLAAGGPAEAERVFRDDLERHARNPRSLFGLHRALVARQKAADAAWVRRAFEDAWKNADTTLSMDEY